MYLHLLNRNRHTESISVQAHFLPHRRHLHRRHGGDGSGSYGARAYGDDDHLHPINALVSQIFGNSTSPVCPVYRFYLVSVIVLDKILRPHPSSLDQTKKMLRFRPDQRPKRPKQHWQKPSDPTQLCQAWVKT